MSGGATTSPMAKPANDTGGDLTARMETRWAAERFLFEEARLLDEQNWDQWLALFLEDGFYWLPASPDQSDPLNRISIVYEDPSVLSMRIRRLQHPRAWTLHPAPRTAHVIGNVMVENPPESVPGAPAPQEGDLLVSSMATIAEFRPTMGGTGAGHGDRRLYAGRQTHLLRPDAQSALGFRIALKRLDLIDCDDASGVINYLL